MLLNCKIFLGGKDHQSSSPRLFRAKLREKAKEHPKPKEPKKAVDNEQEKESDVVIPTPYQKLISRFIKLLIL
jgi:hypothetical protein